MKWLVYSIRRWWLTRELRVIAFRRQELQEIVSREKQMMDYEEMVVNRKLRDLQTEQLNSRLIKVG